MLFLTMAGPDGDAMLGRSLCFAKPLRRFFELTR
jgi:hypothetical protein